MTEPLSMDQAFIKKLTEIVLANLSNENFGAAELAKLAGMNRVNLYRKLRSAVNQDISQFIREVRLKRAMEMLLNNEGTASEIAFKVGFSSPAYFNKCFHDHYGYPPGEVKKREPLSPENVTTGEPVTLTVPLHQSGLNKSLSPGRRQLSYQKILITSAGIISGLLLIYIIYTLIVREPDAKSIFILPFENLSDDKENQYFVIGLEEDILNQLYKISDLRVISRTTSEHFRGTNLTVKQIARRVNARNVLEGSVRKYGDTIIISVQLIDAYRDNHIWSDQFPREGSDIPGIQGDIAIAIAQKLNAVLSDNEIRNIKKITTQNPEAYDYYLDGRFLINKRTEEGFRKSLEYFNKAVNADSTYALAYAGLADAWFLLTYYQWYPRPGGYEQAKKYALQALNIDGNLAEALTVQGALLCWYEWKWEEARTELQKAVKLNPNFVTAHSYYAELLNILGENNEARRQINMALELEPFFPLLHWGNIVYYYNEGKFRESLDAYRKAVELGLWKGGWGLPYVLFLRLGDDRLVVEAVQNSLSRDTLRAKYANKVKEIYDEKGINGLINWVSGVDFKANPDPLQEAGRLAMMGRRNEALNFVEKAYDECIPGLPEINNSPDYDFLRLESRFQAIIKKMGLSEYQKRK